MAIGGFEEFHAKKYTFTQLLFFHSLWHSPKDALCVIHVSFGNSMRSGHWLRTKATRCLIVMVKVICSLLKLLPACQHSPPVSEISYKLFQLEYAIENAEPFQGGF